MKLSIVIVNYNVRYFLEQALLSVRKATQGIDTEVFVVDNNSVDDSVEMVRSRFPEVILIANKDNPGFSIANNQAINQSKGEYVLLLNPDTIVNEDTFAKCIKFMDNHPDAGGLGCRMIDGSGAFLPESKRGFPSPFVAFCKTFGLSKIFPKSKVFGRYHLGYLDEKQIHEIEVLAGAFMFMRKSVLDKIGLLDEAFFMYGEDIDLSYRIIKAGYKNYYFPDTTIIHYKGESTKKGSLNYVRVFYNAMIIFAKKHFTGTKGWLFIIMLQIAIYFRAGITLSANISRKVTLPLFDASLIVLGLFFLKDFWANYYFKAPDYYDTSFLYVNVPLYTSIWILSIFFSGGYDENYSIRRPVRGLLFGSILLAAVYGFLDLEFRSSRMLIVLGAFWSFFAVILTRLILHFIQYKNFNLGKTKSSNLCLVGSKEETERSLKLLQQAGVNKNIIGTIIPQGEKRESTSLGYFSQMDEIIRIYKINEIIFCSKDIPSHEIMDAMTRLGPSINYRILPEESFSIIGSQSKNTSGKLYTIDIEYKISNTLSKRNKRIMDILFSISLLALLPITLLTVSNKSNFIRNILQVFWGQKTWVGYVPTKSKRWSLPKIRPSVLSPSDVFDKSALDDETLERLNFLYAKDYTSSEDLNIIWKGWQHLGN